MKGKKQPTLKQIFIAFCSHGKGMKSERMDGATFVKCLKDSNAITRSTTADFVFAKLVEKGQRNKMGYHSMRSTNAIDFVEFKQALQQVADKDKTSYDALKAKILAQGGPAKTLIKSAPRKSHAMTRSSTVDDKQGLADTQKRMMIAKGTDRAVRGRKKGGRKLVEQGKLKKGSPKPPPARLDRSKTT